MIIVRLRGGLGNQLFQYALARKLADLHGTEWSLDITGYATYPYHVYSLHPFAIVERFATEKEIQALKRRKRSFFAKKQSYYLQSSIEEPHFHFDPNILKAPGDVYLDGYWQSEKYFAGIESVLRREFQITVPPTEKNRELGEMIAAIPAVSVHVRRGDYVSNPVSLAFHGVSPVAYYQQAIERMQQSVPKAKFFVFSDDPAWVKLNLPVPKETMFVDHNGPEKNYEDFRLMTYCSHHILANSTFSWWAAWLCEQKGKIIIGPKQWFQDRTLRTEDLFPEGWIRL